MNTVYADGGPAVTGDDLNTFVQTLNTMSDLRAFIGIDGMQVSVLGRNAVNDLGGGTFYWNATGTAADDNGVKTVVPNGAGAGEWSRILPVVLTPPVPARQTTTPANPTRTTSTAGAMMGTGVSFVPNKSGQFLLWFNGAGFSSVVNDGGIVNLRYGTGSLPVNGGALTGTIIGQSSFAASAALEVDSWGMLAFVGSTPLILGTTYWLDVSLKVVTSGTVTIVNLYATVVEL